ncbi:MAG: hypothetical protein EOP49_02790 [Sphingobacteriales bacterium]|nr:MAG: hypothetical protein EOP49_02790 [Sphingobacteriales bacterium]
MLKTFLIANRIATLLAVLISSAYTCQASANANNKHFSRFTDYPRKLVNQSDTLKSGMTLEGINTATPGKIILMYRYDASIKKAMPVSSKLIVVNGKAIEAGTIGGLEGSDYIIILNPDQGFKKYGKKGELGVIEANGTKITLLDIPPSPPSGPPPTYK